MKKLYLVIADSEGVEGMFDENHELLGFWCFDDAMWRTEYLNPFMKKLGFQIEVVEEEDESELVDKFKKILGV